MHRELILLALLAVAGNCHAANDSQSLWAVKVGNPAANLGNSEGGYHTDSVAGMALDANGNIYLAGTTYSPDFPGAGTVIWNGNTPVVRNWVGKLKPDGSEFEFIVFLDNMAYIAGLVLDPEGNIVVAGTTSSVPADAPASLRAGPLGDYGVVVVKLNPTGTAMPFTAYIGGSLAAGVAVDATGAVYVTGTTAADFPVTAGAFQSAPGSSFVLKLDPTGTRLVYSTYLGNGNGEALSIAVDSSGAAYIGGPAGNAGGYPVTGGAVQATPGSGFAAKLNSAGSALLYGTYVPFFVTELAVDAGGNAYLTGLAEEALPVTPGAFQSTPGAFCVAKLNASGSAFLYATYFGSKQSASVGGLPPELEAQVPHAIAVDAAGNAHFTGSTPSGLPVFQAVEPSFYGGVCPSYEPFIGVPAGNGVCTDAFAAALDPTGSKLVYSTYLNGPLNDSGNAVAVDGQGNVYVAGSGSIMFPVSTPVSNGGSAFVVKLGIPQARPVFTSDAVTNAASFVPGLVAPGGIGTVFLSGLTGISGIVQASQLPLPTEIQGVSVKVGGVSAPLFAVADVDGVQQINFQVPSSSVLFLAGPNIYTGTFCPLSGCMTDVEVWQNGAFAAVFPKSPDIGPPGVFTMDGVYGAIQHLDYSLITPSSPAHPGELVIVYATGLGQVMPPVETGWPAPLRPTSTTLATPSVTIGGLPANLLFSGLPPTTVGLYQLNVRVPANAPSGDLDLVVSLPAVMAYDPSSNGFAMITYPRDSKPVKISVR